MKKLLILFVVISFCSCQRNKNVTAFLKPFKELTYNFSDLNQFNEVSFLFIVDSSGSMSKWKETMAKNLDFLDSIFLNHPYYKYNFAFTSMSPASDFMEKPLLWSVKESYCPHVDQLIVESEIGPYLRYNYNEHADFNIKDLICPISENITQIEGNVAIEPYFETLFLIIDRSESDFRSRFFSKENFLVLIFLSDVSGELDKDFKLNDISTRSDIEKAGEKTAQIYWNKIFNLKQSDNIRTYASVMLPGDQIRGCVIDRDGLVSPELAYPFHLYKFIEKTGGLKTSLCDPFWGKKLKNIYKDLSQAFFKVHVGLNEIPEISTIEVYFNGKKVPKNNINGWFFNPEKVAISFGSQFDLLLYKDKDSKKDIINIRYKPLNSDLLNRMLF